MGTWKRRTNNALARVTGYKLKRARRLAARAGTSKRARAAPSRPRDERTGSKPARSEQTGSEPEPAGSKAVQSRPVQPAAPRTTEPAAEQPQPQPSRNEARPPKQKREKPEFPADYDADYCEIIRKVRPYTMTGREKLHALITATKYIRNHKVPGSVVECGVWRGGSMHAVARTLDGLGDHSRDLYLFDTFEGMTEPTVEDARRDGQPAAHILESAAPAARVHAYASLEDVQAGFADVPYPPERIHFVQGRVEETVPEKAPEQIALLRLDTDWYVSTKHELEHLYPRLVSGGVLIIDDYGWWEGARKATEEFLAETGAPLLLIRMATGRVAVKP